jgi:ribonuclease R
MTNHPQGSGQPAHASQTGRGATLSHAVLELLRDAGRPLHLAEIASRLEVRDRAALRSALDDLVYDGLVSPRAGQRFTTAAGARERRDERLEGSVHVNPRGFAFVRVPGARGDVFVAGEAVGGAMHGDRVVVRVVATGRRGREGEIVEVVSRSRKRVAGVLGGRRDALWLEPDDARVRGPIQLEQDELTATARPGLAAVADITRYPEEPRELPVARLAAVLGEPGEPDVEVAKILAENRIEEEHPPAALAEAKQKALPEPDERRGREDLRHVPLVAIDPTDARDHDDAVWVGRTEDGGYDAWIAIADVSHYVTEGSALDASALERGCSVYLPDRAVPMIPPELSAVLCSLLPHEERLCLAVHCRLDPTGAVLGYRLVEGVMRAQGFLTYEGVARALGLSATAPSQPEAEALRDQLQVTWDLSTQLRKRRMRRGALDLDVPEAHVEVDVHTRAPVAVGQRTYDPGVRKAYRIVEELMLLANELVARFLLEHDQPAVFRIHPPPDMEKLERFALQCKALGVDFDVEDGADPKKISKFLRKVAAHPKAGILHSLLLRALQQASYSTINVGHFGLASEAYLHFTSPIRRYPDLVVHRLVRAALRGEPPPMDTEALNEAASRASERERTAMDAERSVADLYRTLFMQAHIGDRFTATVVSVNPTAVYLRIDDPFVDVLVPMDRLGEDSYEADDVGLKAVGTRSGEQVTLGDEAVIEIEEASIARRVVVARRVVQRTGKSAEAGRGERRPTRREKRDSRREAAAARRGKRKEPRRKPKKKR